MMIMLSEGAQIGDEIASLRIDTSSTLGPSSN